ncbi:tudor domain-containing protein 6 isoform X1 [Arvicanthis niloticus]|uniref:tudor domain-containing protein 6 isoform X1 n=1 Tax=Arvicanthis niloticus TaxID=61156 RepID=UPI0014872040|nr:tudor domain-containing protein 6 isoform X1 [Arvicanthis niloticus]
MSSTPGLPTPGASLALRVSFVDVHPEVIPVQLWGLVGQRREEYVRLSREIQEAAATRGPWALGGASASPGELCLVQVGLMWHRCRVVSRQAQDSRVFLLDEGRTITAGAGSLAPGRSEFFHLPSEVLGCVLAGLVPAGGGGTGGGEPQHWSPSAVDFLSNLQGKEVHGRVLDVLLLHRLVLLEVPVVSQQMEELGLARQVPDSLFCSLLKRYLTAAGLGSSGAPVLPRAAPKQEHPGLDYFYPQLQLGVTEPVVVTQVCHPHRIHCQLRSLSQEIHRLSENMAQVYRAPTGTEDEDSGSATWEEKEESPDKPGSPCASCGLDGQWYRALLLETFRPQRCAQVLHVDYGRKELVSCSSLRYLLPEYFRMPVVTYPCALYGLWDCGRGWSRSQVGDLKALILGQAVNAKIEFYCSFEHMYYVTLYGEDGINLNSAFGVQSCCLADRFLQSQGIEEEEDEDEDEVEAAFQSQSPTEEMEEEVSLPSLRSIRLKMNTFYDAQVEFVKSPSEFWIRLRKHNNTFTKLTKRMCSFYSSASKLDGVILKPEPDDLCCVKWKENGYYRAMVTRLDSKSVDVFLVDRGNSENVDWCDVRMLLPQFRRLPILALKCTLADIWPLGKAWSQEAISFFKKTVLHKELVVHILDKQDRQYVIEILDESRTGEENISKVIAQAGYAKFQEFETKENIRLSAHSPGHVSGHFISESSKIPSVKKVEGDQKAKKDNKTLSVSEALADTVSLSNIPTGQTAQDKEKVMSDPSLLMLNFLKTKPDCCGKGELEVGSTVEVKVSHIENPGSFWCQLMRNAQGFRTLMCDIEDYCKSEPSPYEGDTRACLAKRTANGRWSRAVISGAQSLEHVRVVFVDYGDKDVVSMKDILSVSDVFFKVRAQAFRCSLYNLIQPTGENPFVWDEKAVQAFSGFIDNAWQNNLELKCTIFALASRYEEEWFNVVDLLTPFQSACHFLVEKRLARPVKLQKPLEPSVQLHSYYYSTHDLKIGSEELVYITHADDPWTFYCQLARNTNILEQLSYNIMQLSKSLLNLKASTLVPGTLCLAKYTDGNWYRGIIIEKEPSKVFFVDFGNTYVASDHLLPIPRDAYDVLLLPMQAVKCSLSDIPHHIPEEVTAWFQETVLDKSLKALVVAKDPDGRLIIELYDESVQINASINEKLGLLGYKNRTRKKDRENEVILHETEALEGKKESVKPLPTDYLGKSGESKAHSAEIMGESCKPKISPACKELKYLQGSAKANLVTPYQDSTGNKSDGGFPLTREKKEDMFANSPMSVSKLDSALPERRMGEASGRDLPPKFCEFPQKTIAPGFKTSVYVSHINDLSDFYIQLIEDEAEINRLSERLNDIRTRPQYHAGPPWQSGDVICAVFPEDNLWYRAVVLEQQPNDLLSVQFIDYGNMSVVHTNRTGRLGPIDAVLPALCFHCCLRGLLVPEVVSCKEMVSYFSQRTEEAQIRCEFVKFQGTWEVILTDEHGIIAEDMMNRFAFNEKSQAGLTTQTMKGDCSKTANKPNIDTSVFLNWYNPKAKLIKAYATVIDGPEYFWCQFADSEKLQYLETEVQSAAKQLVDRKSCTQCPQIGDPCIVRYREDGHYYRALITNISDDHLASVRLVDFGNMEDCVDTKALWSIPSELLRIPMQAFPCCLSGFAVSGGMCPQEGNDYFYDIITEDMLEITILEIKRDVCDIPLAVVELRSKGENINEKMKKYAKVGTPKSDLYCEKHGSERKGGLTSPDLGLQKPSHKIAHDKTFYMEARASEFSERLEKNLNIETKPNKFYERSTRNIFDTFENSCKGKMGSERLEGNMDYHFVDRVKYDENYLIPGFNSILAHASEPKELLELNSLEVPLSPDDDECKEFLELESIELQHSPAGEEEKEELGLGSPMAPLSPGCQAGATLGPFMMQLPLDCEAAEKQLELELPTPQLSLDDSISPLSATVSQSIQESRYAEDERKSSCTASSDDDNSMSSPLPHHGKGGSSPARDETNLSEGEFPRFENRDSTTLLTPLFSEEEAREGRKCGSAVPAVQLQNTYTLKGFSVGSKCVVWSSLRNTWSKCEILELAEEGTRVLNLSNGVEETVSPENVWNGIPKVDMRPSEAVFQTVGKDLLPFMSSDDTIIKGFSSVSEEECGGDADSTAAKLNV